MLTSVNAKPGHRRLTKSPPSIAKNCRTSVKMIEDFYAAHIKNRLDVARINTRRPHSHRNREAGTFQGDGGR
jgi:hypothetical protein